MIPNHILILGPPQTGKLRVADFILNGKRVDDLNPNSHSGVIVKSELNTKYYHTQLNILVDEYPSERSCMNEADESLDDYLHKQLDQWFEEFKSSECKELRDVLDGLIFTINLDNDSTETVGRSVETITKLKDIMEAESNDELFMVVLGVSQQIKPYEDFEDIVIQNGLEFIYFNESGQNDFKDKLGRDRLMEILETHSWKNIDNTSDDSSYRQNRLTRLKNEMTQSLLNDDDDGNDNNDRVKHYDNDNASIDAYKHVDRKIDLTEILGKLNLAKGEASNMKDQQERELYANRVIDELIDYL